MTDDCILRHANFRANIWPHSQTLIKTVQHFVSPMIWNVAIYAYYAIFYDDAFEKVIAMSNRMINII